MLIHIKIDIEKRPFLANLITKKIQTSNAFSLNFKGAF